MYGYAIVLLGLRNVRGGAISDNHSQLGRRRPRDKWRATKHAMKNFDLNIDKILENWEVFHAIREVIANALDEQVLTGTAKPEIFRDKNGWWHIRDFGRGLQYQDLIQAENPEKLSNPHVMGKFGIWLKDALATFNRRGVQVLIRSRFGDIGLARVSKHSFEEIVTLHATVDTPSDSTLVGTDCCLYGLNDSDIDAAKALFLSFSGQAPIEETRFGSVLPLLQSSPSIYINGMKIAEEERFLFSYNITSINAAIKKALNRERQNLGRSVYSDRVKAILLACNSKSVASALAEDLQRHCLGTSHEELGWLDVQEHAVRILNANGKAVFVSSSELIQRPDVIDTARSSGSQVVTVPEALAEKIDGITDTLGRPVVELGEFIRQHNESFQFHWVMPGELSEAELEVWHQNDRILGLIGGLPSSVQEIRISETMATNDFGSDVSGLWDPQNGWIILKRSLLPDLGAYAGTLLHECLHAKYDLGDVSREFEDRLTRLCGELAARIIGSKSR